MATTGREYTLAVRIAGRIDRTFNSSLAMANGSLKNTFATVNQSFNMLDKGYARIMKVGTTAFNMLSKAALVASVAVGAATVAAVNAGNEFESAFAGVKKTIEATEEEYVQLRQDIRDMAKEVPSTAVEIAGVMEVAGQLGIAKESLSEFTRVMIDLGVTTNLSATEAATALAKFANITNMDTADYEKLGSVVVDLGNNFATTELEIVEMATKLAASGELVGLTEAQIMALATSMSSVGIAAEKGGSTMSKLLKKMQVAVELESNALSKYASVANMTGEEFKQTFQKDAVEALSAFIDGLNDTERNGKSAIVILEEMGLNEIRLSNTILSLANADELMTKAIKMANEAWDENTALSIEANKRYATLESKIKILKNTITDLGISVYDDLREPLSEALDWLTKGVSDFTAYATGPNGISKWISNIQTTLPTVIRNVKTFGTTVLDFLDPLIDAGKWLVKNPKFLANAFIALGSALATYKIASTLNTVVQTIVTLVTNPKLLLITAIIVAVAAAVGGIVSHMNALKQKNKEIINQNIAKHFGNIALSLEDIEEVADHLINKNGVLTELHNAISAFDELDTIQDSIDSAITAINKTHWKVGIGIELKDEEIASYKESLEEFVVQTQDYITQSQYALTLAVGVAYDKDDEFGTQLISEINEFYNASYGELEAIGTKLNEAITNAFTDGLLDIDEAAEIQELLQQLAEIQNAIAGSNFSAALTSLSIDYGLASGVQLDADTFKNLQAEVNEQLALFKDENNEARDKLIQNAALRYNQGFITKEQYEAEVAKIAADFEAVYGESLATATQFLLQAITDSGIATSGYAEMYSMAQSLVKDLDFSEYGTYERNGATYSAENPLDAIYINIMDSSHELEEVRGVISQSISDLLSAMEPSMEDLYAQRDSYIAAGKAVPENIIKGIEDYEALLELQSSTGVVADAIKYGLQQSGQLEELNETLAKYGTSIDEVLADVIEENSYMVTDAVQGVINEAQRTVTNGRYQLMQDTFNKYGIDTGLPEIKIPEWKGIPYNMPGHADGGIFTIPHIAAFAEEGPEAAIPLDGSMNAINLWKRTGQLLGMGSVLDDIDLSDSQSPRIEYAPTLIFNGDAPSRNDLESAMRTSQEEFEAMMARYIKDHGRVSFG